MSIESEQLNNSETFSSPESRAQKVEMALGKIEELDRNTQKTIWKIIKSINRGYDVSQNDRILDLSAFMKICDNQEVYGRLKERSIQQIISDNTSIQGEAFGQSKGQKYRQAWETFGQILGFEGAYSTGVEYYDLIPDPWNN